MTDTTFSNGMRRLDALYPHKPTKDGMAIYLEKLRHYSDDAFTSAVEHLITNSDDRGRYPTIGALVALSEMFESRMRDRELEQTKAQERDAAKKLFSGQISKDDYAKRCMALIVGHMTGKTTRKQYLDGMEGLNISTSELKRWYAYHGLPIEKEPLSQYERRIEHD